MTITNHELLARLFNFSRLKTIITDSKQALPHLISAVKEFNSSLDSLFSKDYPVAQLLAVRSLFVDQILMQAWSLLTTEEQPNIALVAVGGYGRNELHPCSDIDILIIISDNYEQQLIEKFIAYIWDISLQISHSVRTVNQAVYYAKNDSVNYTNLLESRLVMGSDKLYQELLATLSNDNPWPNTIFFQEKLTEQCQRHKKYNDTAYNLEPNVKGSPGGMRDIQIIQWLNHSLFHHDKLDNLVAMNFINDDELQLLLEAQIFLWKLRYALHLLSGRADDRLLLDHQLAIAKQWGYQDTDAKLAVEQLMKNYYRTAHNVREINSRLLQSFSDFINPPIAATTTKLNDYLTLKNNHIYANTSKTFSNHPQAILEIFLFIAKYNYIEEIGVETIKWLHDAKYVIDDNFRSTKQHQQLFIAILNSGKGIYKALTMMNRHGILGAYLPEFNSIVGQMQFDLFHIYTVDVHTLFVIKKLLEFTNPDISKELSLCAQIMHRIPNIECLYIAALYHDIAKGRGGDHSSLGANDVLSFCQRHSLSKDHTQLIVWLVQNHLLMSITAQRKDISDPQVINAFADSVQTTTTLDYLYILTIADIRATNPKLWNKWKHSLLLDLYTKTTTAIEQRLADPDSNNKIIASHKQSALEQLTKLGFSTQAITHYWHNLDDDYFLRHQIEDIIWQMQALLANKKTEEPLILIRQHQNESATEIFIHLSNSTHVFAAITNILDRLGLTIVAARVFSASNGYCYDTFTIIQENGTPINEPTVIANIRQRLAKRLTDVASAAKNIHAVTPRMLQPFHYPSIIHFDQDPHNQRTVLELITPDKPGLLARIGQVFIICETNLLDAKIATMGERVEDVFFITNSKHQPLSKQEELELEQNIRKYLDKDNG